MKRAKVLLGVLLVSVMLAGCAKGAEPTGSKSQDTVSENKETVVATETAGTEKEETAAEKDSTLGGYKIGVTVQTLNNQAWSAPCAKMQSLADEKGNTLTYVSCDENVSKQIEQIENFISAQMDAIMINAVDYKAIESVCKEARDAGIKVMCWDDEMENSDLNWLVSNYDVGVIVGEQAAKFIKDKFPEDECEVAILNYPQTPILLERENGILDALKKNAPNAKVIAQQPAINANEGLSAMETILQSNPELKVVCCIGGGGAVGANEALKAANMINDEVGIFAIDATDQELAAITAGEAIRMSVMLTGVDEVRGIAAYELIMSMLDGTAKEKNIYRDAFPVTADNVGEYYKAP